MFSLVYWVAFLEYWVYYRFQIILKYRALVKLFNTPAYINTHLNASCVLIAPFSLFYLDSVSNSSTVSASFLSNMNTPGSYARGSIPYQSNLYKYILSEEIFNSLIPRYVTKYQRLVKQLHWFPVSVISHSFWRYPFFFLL